MIKMMCNCQVFKNVVVLMCYVNMLIHCLLVSDMIQRV